jgi:hypothetical protein
MKNPNQIFIRMLDKQMKEADNPETRSMIEALNWPDNQMAYTVSTIYQCILEDGLEIDSIDTDGTAYRITFKNPDNSQRIWFSDPDEPLSVLLVPKGW